MLHEGVAKVVTVVFRVGRADPESVFRRWSHSEGQSLINVTPHMNHVPIYARVVLEFIDVDTVLVIICWFKRYLFV